MSDVCKKVKFVSFSDNKILHVLKRFKNLEEAIIRFQKCDAFKNELIDLREMPKLKKLKIACNNYPDIS